MTRTLLLAAAAFAGLSIPAAEAAPRRAPAAPPPIDLSTPEGALTANRKIGCSTLDNTPAVYYWAGDVFSRREGERDRLLFRTEGMNVRQCATVNDPVRGLGYRLVSRELLIYKDAQTGETLKTWTNPWSGETVEVLHVANDPVNSTAYARNRDGTPNLWRGVSIGPGWQINTTVPLFYSNPLGGAYQAEVGGTYHATEMFNFMGETADLIDPTKTTATVKIGWVRMSDWLPWMKMNGRDGVIYMHTAGRKLADWSEMPASMMREIEQHYPDYRAPPPVTDDRPNETSWTYYQKVREGKVVPPRR